MKKDELTGIVKDLDEADFESNIRPRSLKEYVGQDALKANLEIFIKASRSRNEPLDHCLFYGPPGLGKTTLAYIIANELDVSIKVTSGPAIEKSGDLAAILTNLEKAMCCLSMKSTGLVLRSRRSFTLQWRNSSLIL